MLELIAATAIAAVSPQWIVRDKKVDGSQACVLAQEYADETFIMFMVADQSAHSGVFMMSAKNPNWSIKEGDDLGLVLVSTDSYHFGSGAKAGENTFYLVGDMISLDPFLRSAAQTGFSIIRPTRDEPVGTYQAGGLASAIDTFDKCVKQHFDPSRDPFRK